MFNREPAAILRAFSALIALLVGFGAFGFTEDVGQAIIAFVSAAVTVFLAFRVRPLAPNLLTGVITTGAALLAAYDLIHITERQTGLFVSLAEMVLVAFVTRPQSTPLADPRPPEHSV